MAITTNPTLTGVPFIASIGDPSLLGNVGIAGNLSWVNLLGGIGISGTLPPTPPIISAILATVTGSDVTVTWTTDLASDSFVEYGPTIAYGTAVGDPVSMVTSHSITLFGIADGSYHFRVSSLTAAGGLAYSTDQTFSVGGKSMIVFSLPFPVYANMNGTRQSIVGSVYLNETVV